MWVIIIIVNVLNMFFIATLAVCVFAGVCVWHADRMAPHLQRLSVLRPVGAERAAAVGRVAVRGGRHGQLVRQDGVCSHRLQNPAFIRHRLKYSQHLSKPEIFSQVELYDAHPTHTLALAQRRPFTGAAAKT